MGRTNIKIEFDTLYNIVFDEIKELATEVVDTYEVAEIFADACENEQKEQQALWSVA